VKRKRANFTTRQVAKTATLPVSAEQFGELVAAVCHGSMEHIPWSTAIKLIRGHLKANWTSLVLRPASQSAAAQLIRDGGKGAELFTMGDFHYEMFSLTGMTGITPGQVTTIDETVNIATWRDSRFYKAWVEPYGIRYIMSIDVAANDGADCRLMVTRGPDDDDFALEDRALLQALHPYWRAALHLHSRLGSLESERQLYSSAVEGMLVGTVVMDGTGRIIRCNATAKEILAEKDGLLLRQGILRAEIPGHDHNFQRLINTALDSSSQKLSEPQATSVPRGSGRSNLSILIRPIPHSDLSGGKQLPAVAIFIRDPARQPSPSEELLRQLFGLTAAEATLALLLANGRTLDEAAQRLNIRKNTARAQLSSIFDKTGARRQTTLMHILMNSVASIS
jgi:DNA-binding CsgD family transcriptional regulator